MVKCAVLVVAAGRGHRFGMEMPKQYQSLNDRLVLKHSLATFCAHPNVHFVRAVIHPDDQDLYKNASLNLPLLPPVFGGQTRQDSVRLGLESLQDIAPDVVLIHDGARPFVDFGTINRVILNTKPNQGAIPALPVTDTLKKANNSQMIQTTVDRSSLFAVQTPQGFMFDDILKAHQNVKEQQLTDDASVAEVSNINVILVKGSENNFKITTPADLERAKTFAGLPKIRTGSGFDVHCFEQGSFVTLCGVKIPHTHALKGHSDADVALHALTDALLGAIGSGDIGTHFPPSDNQWKGAASSVFLRYALALVKGLGLRIFNIDLTVICESPKIAKHRLEMVESLSNLLEITANQVSIKATTTEGLGFTGRKEGVACQATVLIG